MKNIKQPSSAKRALTIYLAYQGIFSALFWLNFAVNGIYHVTTANLDPFQLVLTGTALEAGVFLFEIPTGVVADTYSRRLSVIIGTFLIGAGFILDGSIPIFLPILMAQLVWGIGYTFTSGALEAWITDEISEENAADAFLRGAQFGQFGSVIGALAGTALGALSITLPIVLSGILFFVLGLFLILRMPEEGFQPTPREDRTNWGSMLHTFRSGFGMIKKRPALITILAVGLFFGLYSEGLDRMWEAHLLEQFTFPLFSPVVWVGLIQAFPMLLAIPATGQVKRRIDLRHMRSLNKALLAASSIVFIGMLAFGWVRNLWLAIGFFVLLTVAREVTEPIYTSWVNHRIDSNVRATVISMSSQVNSIGQIFGGPPIGFLANRVSIQAGLTGSSLLLFPVLVLLTRSMQKNIKE